MELLLSLIMDNNVTSQREIVMVWKFGIEIDHYWNRFIKEIANLIKPIKKKIYTME